MAEVETTPDLFVMALKDLHDGARAMADRLPSVRANLDNEDLRDLVEEDARRSAGERDRLADIIRGLDAEDEDARNIWLRAILDDADNDAATIVRGRLRDIALVGALRKGKQSQRVSYETAVALAGMLGNREAAKQLDGMAEDAEQTDTALAQGLARLSTAE